MKSLTLLASILVLFSSVSMAKPVKFSVDPEHALPHFSFNHLGLSKVTGRFDRISGTIELDQLAETGSIEITIDMDSINTGVEKLDKHLRSGDFFNVRKYPVATFKSTSIEFDEGRPVSINGDLNLHGVTQSVSFIVTSFKRGPHALKQNREAIGGNAKAIVSRTAFGLGRFTPTITDGVTISIGLEAIRN